MEAAAPRGDFYLGDDAVPVVLVSAGIGITPVLAMLHALAAQHSEREIWWLHITRDAQSLAFGGEVSELIDVAGQCTSARVLHSRGPADPTRRRSRRSDCLTTRSRICAAPSRSWPKCVARWRERGSTRRGFTPSCSARYRLSTQASRTRRTGHHTCPTGRREPGRRCLSRAAGSPSTGRRATTAFSNSPRRATSRHGSPAAAAYVISASLRWWTEPSPTRQPPLELPAEGTVLICSAQPRSGCRVGPLSRRDPSHCDAWSRFQRRCGGVDSLFAR